MLPSVNPALKELPVYQPGRPIEEVARELGLPPETIIKLASNENPLGPSRMAVAAMRKALNLAHLYPDGSAFYLKQKLAAKLGVEPANLILGNGSNEILEFAGHALLAPGTEAIVSPVLFCGLPDCHGVVRRPPGRGSSQELRPMTSTPCCRPSRPTRALYSSPTRIIPPAPPSPLRSWPASFARCPRPPPS